MHYNAENVKQKLNTAISNIVNSDTRAVVCPEKDFTRNRVFTLETMIRIILGMGGQSLPKELYAYFNKCGIIEKSAKKSAFVQQRAKIKPELFHELMQEFNSLTNRDDDLYEGYKLLAVDGSDVYVAHNENTDSYIQNGDKRGFNLLHLNALYNLMSHIYQDATIVPKPICSERTELLKMLHASPADIPRLIVADRGYASLNTFEHLNRIDNTDYLFRIKNKWIKEIADLPYEEFDKNITLHLRTGQTKADKALYETGKAKWVIPYSHHAGKYGERTWDFEDVCDMTLRVIRIRINDTGDDSTDFETIITSLNRFQFPLGRIKEIYHLRWGIETSFRDLKYSVGLVNFHAKNEDYVMQEIFAKLVIYNFSELIARAVIVKQDTGNKLTYAVNFTMAIYLCMDYFRHRGNSPPDIDNLISEYTEPVRPDRADKRKFRVKHPVWFLYRVA